MSEKTRLDRCCNPWITSNEVGHVGKDLRKISKAMKRNFPHLPQKGKICSDCRTDSLSANLSISVDNTENMEQDIYKNHDTDMSASASELKSSREIELEEMLTELEEKYKSLQGNDPLKLKILTIAPSSWSVNKIAKEFGSSWQLAKNPKN